MLFCFVFLFNATKMHVLLGYFFFVSGICLAIGILAFPAGWDNDHIRSICGNSDDYELGDCGIRWAFVLAIIAFFDRITRHAFPGRRALVRSISHIELGAVERAHQHRPPEPTFAEWRICMGAVVLQSVQLAVHPAHHDAITAMVGEGPHVAVGHVGQVAKQCRIAHAPVTVSPPSSGPSER